MPVWDCLGLFGCLFGFVLDSLGKVWVLIWNCFGLFVTAWPHVLDYLGLSGAV